LGKENVYDGMKKLVISGLAVFAMINIAAQETRPLNAMISPNPVRNYCEIRTSVPAEIKVLDLKGNVVLHSDQEVFHDVNMTHLEEGIYFVYLIGRNEVQTLRLVKSSGRG
jgi:hypothetical protein